MLRCCCGPFLHLTGTQAVNAEYEHPGQALGHPRRHRHFRQLDSKAPGHPGISLGVRVETTTGRWAGIATSVGMAMGGAGLPAATPAGLRAVRLRHLCGVRRRLPDGRRRSEAASLAGHLGLDELCWIYDKQSHHHRGKTSITFTRMSRRASSPIDGNVLRVGDANDLRRIEDR